MYNDYTEVSPKTLIVDVICGIIMSLFLTKVFGVPGFFFSFFMTMGLVALHHTPED